MGQSRHFDRAPTTSGLPQSTDIVRPAQLVRLVPNSDIAPLHSINSSARTSRVGGIFDPKGFGCLKVDDQLKFGWLLDRKFGRPFVMQICSNLQPAGP